MEDQFYSIASFGILILIFFIAAIPVNLIERKKQLNKIEKLRWTIEDLRLDHFTLQMKVEKLERKIKKLKTPKP